MDQAIGLDFGTSYSRAARPSPGGFAEPIPAASSAGASPLLPSVVSFEENGSVQVGWKARERQSLHPDATVSSVKRILGLRPQELEARKPSLSCLLDLSETAEICFLVRARKVRASEIGALILKDLKAQAERFLGRAVPGAVLALPDGITAERQRSFQEMAKSVGFEALLFMGEAQAAALAFGSRHPERRVTAIYDFGGGKVNVSLFETGPKAVKVLATRGTDLLGGEDIDWRISKEVMAEMVKTCGEQILANPCLVQRIKEESEKAKCAVSHRGSYDMQIIDEARGIKFVRPFSRYELNGIAKPLVEQSLELCRNSLKDAGLRAEGVQALAFVGGATRTPLVRETVEKFFRRKASEEISPDLPVAIGAALRAREW